MTRICLGEFDWPDNRGKREFVQLAFLQAIETVDETPLKQLYDMPFRLYRTAKEQFNLDYHAITQPWRLNDAAASLVETLEAEIESWAKNWNLHADWSRRVALATLHIWSCSSREITDLFFQHPGGSGFVPTSPSPPPGFPKYTPYCESREKYIDLVRSQSSRDIASSPMLNQSPAPQKRAFTDSIIAIAEEYCCRVEDIYDKASWVRCRNRDKRNLKQHLEWTVKFQVSGKTFSELAEQANVEQPTVSRAVRDILSILLLPKRSDSKAGRIRGRKSRRPVGFRRLAPKP